MSSRYAIVDDSNIVQNVILWDGESEYDPGDGLTLILLSDDAPVSVSDTITEHGDITDKGTVVAPVDKLDAIMDLLVSKNILTADEVEAATITVDGVSDVAQP